jgi:lipid-binding SYLF domain-containing protein
MKIKLLAVIITAVAVIFTAPPSLRAAGKQVEKVNDAIEVLEAVMSIPEKGIPPLLLRKAHGIAIIPGVIKVGFVLGGRYGTGIVSVRERGGRWSNPSFIKFTGGSIGWQIGAESADIVLVFKSRKSIDDMVKGKFTLGADAAVAAGPVGRHAEAGTDVQLCQRVLLR